MEREGFIVTGQKRGGDLMRLEDQVEKLEKKGSQIRRQVLRMLTEAGSGHPGGCLSVVDFATVLYFWKARHDPKDPDNPYRDSIIFSKGHAAPVQYAILADCGYFPKSDLKGLRKLGGHLQGHPCNLSTRGIEVSTGSLGQGLSVANGIALANRLSGIDSRVYCILGDGEMQEGQVWEAAMTAAHYKLDNVCAFIDYNRLQIDGRVDDVMRIHPLVDKLESFGWNVYTIEGHEYREIMHALDFAEMKKQKPTAIVGSTVKGKGVSFMEDKAEWHGVAPNKEQLRKALKELPAYSVVLRNRRPHKSAGLKADTNFDINDPDYSIGDKVATRDAYGSALVKLGGANKDIVVLDADLCASTKSCGFAKAYPERFFNIGIAEADMICTAAGLSIKGKIPFASTFAAFATGRTYDQIRVSVAYSRKNVKIIGSHAGVITGEDSATHNMTEDIALMRVLPNMTVLSPADAVSAHKLTAQAAMHKGPVYMRTTRGKVPVIYPNDFSFEIGKAYVLREHPDARITIAATGDMVYEALSAYDTLQSRGIAVNVIDVPTIKPIDQDLLQEYAGKSRCLITAEDHSTIGGLGDAVRDAVYQTGTIVYKIGVKDVFAQSGLPEELKAAHGLKDKDIARLAQDITSRIARV